MRSATTLLTLVLLFSAAAHAQQKRVGVAVVIDGPSERMIERRESYVRELLTLTEGEFDVSIIEFVGDWSNAGAAAAIKRAYGDPQIDILLITGFVSSQLAATRGSFSKPTFLPVLLDIGLLESPPVDRTSGIANLNYLTVYDNFGDDLEALEALVSFDKLALLLDQELLDAIPTLRSAALAVSNAKGIELVEVPHDGVHHDLVSRIPEGVQAVFVGGLPRMPQDKFDEMVQALNAAGLASYSFVGTADVERGLLMTSSESRDVERQARLNALNMQAVMLGSAAQDQPVSAPAAKRFTINMATARKIGVSPSFDVMSAATLLNEQPTATGQLLGLVDIANVAMAQNQDLVSQRYATMAGAQQIGIAKSDFWPQLGLRGSYDVRNVSPLVEAGFGAERTADGALSMQQLIYSDPVAANITIQSELQIAREASLHELRLDVVQAATSAYYTVLNAQQQLAVQENNLTVTRRNLELARDRVNVGSSSSADIYRWLAEEARARILVINSRAIVAQAWNRLNRLLHRPQLQRIALKEAIFDEPFVISQREFDSLVSSPADFRRFSDFVVARGLQQAPEISQLQAQIEAKRRDLSSQKRSFWLPDFSLGGNYTNNFGQSGAGGGPAAGEDLNDWTVGLQATIPLFTGGRRRANVNRADFELRQLESARISTAEKVEERIRVQLSEAQAAYGRIDLSEAAADASRKNYDLVADAYARGTVSIIQLLDAQDASLEADSASINSFYSFLITVMDMQRAIGSFDYLLAPDERIELANSMRQYMTSNSR